MHAKKLYALVSLLHRQGLIKRLGSKGGAVWALVAYAGPHPKPPVHPRHVSSRVQGLPAFVPPVFTSWWLTPACDFHAAATARARERGWR
jgi:hypothetical protein